MTALPNEVTRIDPPPAPSVLLELGTLHHRAGRVDAANRYYREVLAVAPDNPDALHLLGIVAMQLGDPAEAVSLIKKASRKRPENVEILCNLGTALRAMGIYDDAEKSFRKASALDRENPDILIKLGLTLFESGNSHDALAVFEQAAALAPDHAPLRVTMGRVHLMHSDYGAARDACDQALGIDPEEIDALILRTRVFLLLNHVEQALDDARRAAALAPQNPFVLASLSQTLKAVGSIDEAETQMRQVIDLLTPGASSGDPASITHLAGAWYDLTQTVDCAGLEDDISAMTEFREQIDDEHAGAVQLDFALGKALTDDRRGTEAMHYFERGNTLKNASLHYDVDRAAADLTATVEAFDEVKIPPAAEARGDLSPIFVVGMPRSGTTLMEQILNRHPDVEGVGELPYLGNIARDIAAQGGPASVSAEARDTFRRRYLDSAALHLREQTRFVDKTPQNFAHIGLIRLLFPGARIIRSQRNAMDTCFSCFRHLFAGRIDFAYDLRDLGLYYQAYAKMMKDWRTRHPDCILDVSYERLVEDPEPEIRRILEFCDLDWNASCLETPDVDTPILTASAVQVRRPIYATSVESWESHSGALEPLIEALNGAAGGAS